MKKRILFWGIKLIGIAIFVYILSKIDSNALLKELDKANALLIGASFPLIFLIYLCKTKRFESLVHATGIQLPLKEHWHIFNIGVFLAMITPGKIGEMGRAAYLRARGIQTVAAVAIAVIDRIIDTAFISIVAVAGAGILFGWKWAVAGAALLGATLCIAMLLRNISVYTRTHITSKNVLPIVCWTCAAWTIYYTWAILLAISVGITAPVTVLISAFTFSGILSLLPIAPSGLGTRDAALVLLLAPYNVPAEQAVALALLMFISIILSGLLGGWYFLAGIQK